MTSCPTLAATATTVTGWTFYAGRAHRTARPTVAAERRAGYDPAPADLPGTASGSEKGPDTGAAADRQPIGGGPVPFGLPVLGQVPRLAAALEAIDTAERRMLDAVVGSRSC
jgi:hypothetical protein